MIFFVIAAAWWAACAALGYRIVRRSTLRTLTSWTTTDRSFYLAGSVLFGPFGLVASMILSAASRDSGKSASW